MLTVGTSSFIPYTNMRSFGQWGIQIKNIGQHGACKLVPWTWNIVNLYFYFS